MRWNMRAMGDRVGGWGRTGVLRMRRMFLLERRLDVIGPNLGSLEGKDRIDTMSFEMPIWDLKGFLQSHDLDHQISILVEGS